MPAASLQKAKKGLPKGRVKESLDSNLGRQALRYDFGGWWRL